MQLRDVIHFYLGAEVEAANGLHYTNNYSFLERLDSGNYSFGWKDIKLVLRPLSDMTEEEWKKCFELSLGIFDQHISDNIKKLSNTEILVTLGKAQFAFGFHRCFDNDVRIVGGLCFFLRRYLIKDELIVSKYGMETYESHFNDMTIEQVLNINNIIFYLLSKHFDLFRLIENGLAINKLKHPA